MAFIVIALGTQGVDALRAAILGAIAALLVTVLLGAIVHKPLTFVPENFMKFVVGAMLTSFGIFWGGRRVAGDLAAGRGDACRCCWAACV